MPVTIYAEYLFAENFIAGLMILRLTACVCGKNPGWLRLLSGAVMCGIFSFIILLNLSGIMTLIYEVLFVAAVTAVSFAPLPVRIFLRIGMVFYCISFLLGGAAMAVMYLSGESGAVNNGFVYIGAAGYLIVLAGGAAGAFMLISVLKFVRQRNEQAHETAELAIDMKGDVLYCTGKVDSANFLKEPVSGRPVSLISADVARQRWGDILAEDAWKDRVRAVPFRSVGGSGIIMAVRCDSLTIDRRSAFGHRKIRLQDAWIGLYDGDFSPGKSEERFAVLIQPEMLYEGSTVKK